MVDLMADGRLGPRRADRTLTIAPSPPATRSTTRSGPYGASAVSGFIGAGAYNDGARKGVNGEKRPGPPVARSRRGRATPSPGSGPASPAARGSRSLRWAPD